MNDWKSIIIAAVFVAGIVVGCVLSTVISAIDERMPKPPEHVHQFGVWTNVAREPFYGWMLQERYCTNCGFYQAGRQR